MFSAVIPPSVSIGEGTFITYHGLGVGVGAGFNFFAGTLDKAPEWMEKASLEWLFRLSKEPKRLWRRYILGGFKYLYYTAEYKLKKKK